MLRPSRNRGFFYIFVSFNTIIIFIYMKLVITETQLKNIIKAKQKDVKENDFERKDVYTTLTDKQIKSIDDLNKDAKFLKCGACRKLYTQTTYKKKKSLPICPWCGKHN